MSEHDYLERMRKASVAERLQPYEDVINDYPKPAAICVLTTIDDLDETEALARQKWPEAVKFEKFERLYYHDCAGVRVDFMELNDLIDIERDNE